VSRFSGEQDKGNNFNGRCQSIVLALVVFRESEGRLSLPHQLKNVEGIKSCEQMADSRHVFADDVILTRDIVLQ